MATLQGKTIKSTYKDLLQVSNSNSGIDTVLRAISDGEGTECPLQLSTTAVAISGANLQFDNIKGIVDANGNEALDFQATTDAVNFARIINAATGNGTQITSAGDDATVDLTLDVKGAATLTLGSADATVAVASTMTVIDEIQHAGDTNNKIGFTADTQTYTTGGSTRMDITDSGVQLGAANARVTTILDEDTMTSDSATALATQQSIKAYADTKLANVVEDTTPQLGGDLDTNSNNIQFDTAHGIQDDSGNEQLTFAKTDSAVNELTITNAAAAGAPSITATGDDTNIGLTIDPKGTGTLTLGSADATVAVASTMTVIDEIQHAGDTNNKIGFTTDTQTFTTGGSTRMNITDSGVQLGAANARVTTVLDEDAMGSDSATALATQQSIKAYVDTQVATQIANVVEDTTPQLGGDLDLNGNSITTASNANATIAPNGTGRVVINTAKSDTGFRFNNTTATNPYGMDLIFTAASPDDNTRYFLSCSDSTAARCYIYSDGDLQNHDNSYGAISDRRLKQDITPAKSQLEDIKKLNIVNYYMISDVEAKGKENSVCQLGLIAQDLKESGMGGLVKYNEEEDLYGVKYSILYMKSVKALQELIVKHEALEARLAKLEK